MRFKHKQRARSRYFLEINHAKWLNIYRNEANPAVVIYTIGNPLIAATIIQHDISAGYNIPPRLMILQKADGNDGTIVIYHLPSSVVDCSDNPALKAALEGLDAKLDEMVSHITSD